MFAKGLSGCEVHAATDSHHRMTAEHNIKLLLINDNYLNIHFNSIAQRVRVRVEAGKVGDVQMFSSKGNINFKLTYKQINTLQENALKKQHMIMLTR